MSKKLLLLTTEFPPQPGGIGNHAFHLAKGLGANQYEVTLLCDRRSDDGEDERGFDAKAGFKLVRIPRKKIILFSYLDRIQTGYALAKNADTVLASGKFSLWLGAFLSLFLKKKLNFQAVFTIPISKQIRQQVLIHHILMFR